MINPSKKNPNDILNSFKDDKYFKELLNEARSSGRKVLGDKYQLSVFCVRIGVLDKTFEECPLGSAERSYAGRIRNEVRKIIEKASEHNELILIEMSNDEGYGGGTEFFISVGETAVLRRNKRIIHRVPTSTETGLRKLRELDDVIRLNRDMDESRKGKYRSRINQTITNVTTIQEFSIHSLSKTVEEIESELDD